MTFDSEIDEMHPAFRELVEDSKEDAFASYLFREVKANNRCRADFALATIDLEQAWKRVACFGHDQPRPPEYFRAYEIAKSQCPLPKDEFWERANIPEERTAEHISWLVENNYLLEDSDGWYRFQYPPSVIDDVTAFELKRKNWERALRQAKKYRSMMGARSYVVMAEEYASRARKNIEEFEDAGIGLMSMTENSLTTHLQPKETQKRASQPRQLRKLDEKAFDEFLKDHPPGEYDRHPPDSDLLERRNSYEVSRRAERTGEAFEAWDG